MLRLLPVVVVMSLLIGCSRDDNRPPIAPDAPKPNVGPQAEKLYAALCASCHGVVGRGGVGPDLSASEYRYGKQLDDIKQSIILGRPGGMPAFASHLTPEQAAILAEYLRKL